KASDDGSHPSVPADEDLRAGCTMDIGAFKEVLAKAIANAKDAAADSIGLGIEMAPDAKGKKLNTTIALVAKDAAGKVVASEIEVAQISEENQKTKSELKDDYGMKKASKISKEWFEQAEALEKYVIGKTAADIEGIKTKASDDGSHPSVPADEDLRAGCTMDIGAFKEVLAKAIANAKDAAADSIGLGIEMAPDAKGKKLNTTIALVAKDAAGKVVASEIEVAQISEENQKTKSELKDDYGMKKASKISKEWYEQANALEEFIKGKTAADIEGIKTKASDDGSHPSVPADEDLRAGCTMDIGSFKVALAAAMK
ncbi:MAG: hypothetical protein RR630_06490, partial [Coprobacillus sp.]